MSWDVVSMLPNTNNNLGLSAVENALDARDHLIPSNKCILEPVKMCIVTNHSVFKDKFCRRDVGHVINH